MTNLGRLSKKILHKIALLKSDPELLGRNVLQFTNPKLFEERLLDVMNAVPMNVRIDPPPNGTPRLNILDGSWGSLGMTGGPNTAINLALHVALQGITVRLVATARTSTISATQLKQHASALLGTSTPPLLDIATAAEPTTPLSIGFRDVFVATHWSTAQQLQPILEEMKIKTFFYLLQEFEPAFYAWSSNYARAIETYSFNYWPVINEKFLADYLFCQDFGRLKDPEIQSRAIIFEPAVDSQYFHPRADPKPRKKRLLFYARPTNSRNMFGIGLMALRKIVEFDQFQDWEFIAIGGQGSLPILQLGRGKILSPAPWLDYAGYAGLLQDADMLLCPMLSPHTSYPVLEMAACGGVSITNFFSTKTKLGLEKISSNIIPVEPSVNGFVEGLIEGSKRISANKPRASCLDLPSNWNAALGPPAERIASIFNAMQREVVFK